MHVQFKSPDLQHSRENKVLTVRSFKPYFSNFVAHLFFDCLSLKHVSPAAEVSAGSPLRASAITESNVTIQTAPGLANVECRENKWTKLN